jgi:hypothetical protein
MNRCNYERKKKKINIIQGEIQAIRGFFREAII